MSVCNNGDTSVETIFRFWTCLFNQQKISMTESALYSHVTLICFMIAVYCFQFQKRALSSFSEWCNLMDACRSRREFWRVFQLFITIRFLCCVNFKQRYNIIRVSSFLIKYFFLFCPFFLIFFIYYQRFFQ